MQAAHLAAPVILGKRSVAHYRLRLLVLVFQEGLDLGLLVRRQIELARKAFQLIVNARHHVPGGLISRAGSLRRGVLLLGECRQPQHTYRGKDDGVDLTHGKDPPWFLRSLLFESSW